MNLPRSTRARAEQLELARQVKLLTLPSEMGESFKSMALVKGMRRFRRVPRGDRAHTL